jgi:hypothetical protein
MSFAASVIAQRPDLAQPVGRLLGQYARLRYGPPGEDTAARSRSIEEFRRAVAQLSVRRSRSIVM